jgi:hypothetical protein
MTVPEICRQLIFLPKIRVIAISADIGALILMIFDSEMKLAVDTTMIQ